MERIPVSPPCRRKLTWRFRAGFVSILALVALRAYVGVILESQLTWLPLESIWDPPPRDPRPGVASFIEFLDYCYVFLFVLWVRDGLILSVDWIGARIWEASRRHRAHSHRRGAGRQPAKTRA